VNSKLAELILEAYPDPLPFLTVEGFTRAAHDDVVHLDDDALANERLLAYLRRACAGPTTPWLQVRITRLDAEAARRKRKARR